MSVLFLYWEVSSPHCIPNAPHKPQIEENDHFSQDAGYTFSNRCQAFLPSDSLFSNVQLICPGSPPGPTPWFSLAKHIPQQSSVRLYRGTRLLLFPAHDVIMPPAVTIRPLVQHTKTYLLLTSTLGLNDHSLISRILSMNTPPLFKFLTKTSSYFLLVKPSQHFLIELRH